MNNTLRALTLALATGPLAALPAASQSLGPRDLDKLPVTQATRTVKYGADPQQFAGLRMPEGKGPFPVAVILHGGCWLAPMASARNSAGAASALPAEGIATLNVEYRRLGNPGGGWPGTFEDVGLAVDHLRELAKDHPLDLDRVVVVGHSAGAPLAAFAAGRPALPSSSPVRGAKPLKVAGAVAVDGPLDLAAFIGPDAAICGEPVIEPLLGGTPRDRAGRLKQVSPAEMPPLGAPVFLVTAELLSAADGEAYREKARAKGDAVTVVNVKEGGHFAVMAPGQAAWIPVRNAIREALGMAKP